jgi:D-cysteine desulfhydrase family pyridoxal phosphate-dependent enzyme
MRNIPRVKIAHLPTPIEPLPRLSAELGGPNLYVKRDDQTGLAMGGNKTRKLEFLVAEALANGAKTLVTAGAGQSNHCRQTAAAAARFGLDSILVLVGSPPAAMTGNLLLDRLFGSQIIWTTLNERDFVLQQAFEAAWENGRRPYLIPYGGSNTTGATAYAYAIQEMLKQGFSPDWIVFPSSSGGTHSGMVLGARLFGFTGQILGISVDEDQETLNGRISTLATLTADFLGESYQFSPQEILIDANYIGQGYGVMGEPEKEAISLFARFEGLLLDPVYTGRAGAGLIDLIRCGKFRREETILFWHTGGVPALFASQYQGLMN